MNYLSEEYSIKRVKDGVIQNNQLCCELFSLAFAEFEKVFGKNVSCTIAYYMGRSIGYALHSIIRYYGCTVKVISEMLNTLINMGVICYYKVHEIDGEELSIVITGINAPRCYGNSEYPLVRGLADALAENGMFNPIYKGKGKVKLTMFGKWR